MAVAEADGKGGGGARMRDPQGCDRRRVAALLLGLTAAALAGCGGGDDPAADGPDAQAAGAAWGSFRDALLRKDWDAAWGFFTPGSQASVEARLDDLKAKVAAGSAEWDSRLRAMDIRPADLKDLDGKAFFAKSMRHLSSAEHLRTSWEKMQGDMAGRQVARVDAQGARATLTLRDAAGREETVGALRVGGQWRVDFETVR
jgi:hypothetical protein